MKKEGHPDYHDVLFVDTATGTKFVCGSTIKSDETEEYNGKTYPVYRASITSASHPFFTGNTQFVDTEGRIDKFLKKYKTGKKAAPKAEDKAEEKKAPAKKATKKTDK
ncbi:MAG: type B 50S ribosomal protein L31 [Rhabdochlamydiaceae bacterium]|nr:type B 50S ribosomal protein L31 [Candidatus Amphrikana amoebophyrae]